MPGGGSSGTATPITSLPYTDSDSVTAGSPKWYLYTAPTPLDQVAVGMYTYSADRIGGALAVATGVFSPNATTQFTFSSTIKKPIQIATAAGVAYYIKVTTPLGTHAYTLSVYAGPNLPAPVGSFFIPDDTVNFPLVLISGTDGTPLQFVSPFPAGETGDIIATSAHIGRILVHDRATDHLVLYDPRLTVLADLPYGPGTGRVCPIQTNHALTSKFYVSLPVDPAHGNKQTVTTVTSAGAFGPTTWVLPNTNTSGAVNGMAPSLDESVLYVVNVVTQSNLVAAPVQRWDLVNSVMLTDLAAGVATYYTMGILVLADSTVVVLYENSNSAIAPFVRRYDPSGATLNTYTFPNTRSGDTRLASALDDPTSFWVWTKVLAGAAPTGYSRFTNVRASDGTVLTTFDAAQYELGIDNVAGAPAPDPQPRFGHSESCPFLLLRVPYPLEPVTGTIAATIPVTGTGEGPIDADLTGYVLPPRHPPCPTV